jgi:subtilisin family serine protease
MSVEDAPEFAQPIVIGDRIIVKFDDDPQEDEARRRGGGFARLASRLDDAVFVLDALEGQGEALRAALERAAGTQGFDIVYIEEDTDLPPAYTPNDPSLKSQWYLTKIGAQTAWDRARGSSAVTLAVLDSGIDSEHPDLKGVVTAGYNYKAYNTDTRDVYGHGTKAAGCAAAELNNARGIAGVAGGVKLMPIKVAADSNGAGSLSAMVNGLAFARQKGARVANLSFQYLQRYASIKDATATFWNAGGVVCCAMGNTGVMEPAAAWRTAVFVGATDGADNKASWSTTGPSITLAAPGVGILTTLRGGSYGSVNGTSFASPICAAAFAVLFSAKASLTPAQALDALVKTALDRGATGFDQNYGFGRINLAAAVARVLDAAE